MSVPVAKRWEIKPFYIEWVFLYADLPESDTIVVLVPRLDGVKNTRGQYARLNKSLYGMNQALKLWYAHLTLCSARSEWRKHRAPTVLKPWRSYQVYALVYLDDPLIVRNSFAVSKVERELATKLTKTKLGPCTNFFGVDVN